MPRILCHQRGVSGAEVRYATQEVDTELRHLQDAMKEKDRLTTATKLQVNTINGALNGLLARAAEVRTNPKHICWQARVGTQVRPSSVTSIVECP